MTVGRDIVRIWLAIGVGITAVLLIVMGLTITFPISHFATLLVIGSALVYGHLHRPGRDVAMDRVVAAVECFTLLVLASLTGGVATYPLAALSTGWVDGNLIAIDTLLGFNWLEYWQFVRGQEWLYILLDIAYKSISVTPLLIILSLIWSNNQKQSYHFVAAFIVSLGVTIAFFPFFPGKTPAIYYLSASPSEIPLSGILQIPVIEHLRDRTQTVIDLAQLRGLITFPSFHAAACVVFAWAAWPVGWLRIPMLVLNGLMLLSTPIHGGHFFADTLAGVAIGFLSIGIVNLVARCAETARPPDHASAHAVIGRGDPATNCTGL